MHKDSSWYCAFHNVNHKVAVGTAPVVLYKYT